MYRKQDACSNEHGVCPMLLKEVGLIIHVDVTREQFS